MLIRNFRLSVILILLSSLGSNTNDYIRAYDLNSLPNQLCNKEPEIYSHALVCLCY